MVHNSPAPEPLNGGRIFQAAVSVFRENFLVLVGTCFLAYLGIWAFMSLLQLLLGLSSLWVNYLVGPVISALILLMTADILSGGPVVIRPHLGRISAVLGPLIILSLVAQVLISLGFVAFIVPGIYVAAGLFILGPVLLFEDTKWEAWGRAWSMSKPYIWQIAGVILRYILVSAFVFIPVVFMLAPYVIAPEDGELVPVPILLQGLNLFVTSAISVFGSILKVLVYHRISGGTASVFE